MTGPAACHATTFSARFMAAAVAFVLTACGGGSSPAPSPAPEPPATLSLSGSSAQTLAGGKPVTLTSSASGNAGAISWSLGAGNPGSLSATSGATVSYLPPAAGGLIANTPVTITASGNGVSKSFALMLYPDPGPAGLSLIAGNPGGAAIIDGTGSTARFQEIGAVATDPAGNLLIAERTSDDLGSQIFRTVSPQGAVTTTTVDVGPSGPGDSDRANGVTGITFGPDGTMYFIYKDAVRKIDAAGKGVLMATAPALRLAVDSASNLYLMEPDRINKVSPAGVVTAFAGMRDPPGASIDGQGTAARFGHLYDMAIDCCGNLFVTDGRTVRKITPDGMVTTLAGVDSLSEPPPRDGAGSAASFNGPWSIAVDADGSLLVLDFTGQRIVPAVPPYRYNEEFVMALRRVSPAGVVTTVKTGLIGFRQVRLDAAGRVLLVGKNQISVLGGDGSLAVLAGMRDDTVEDVDGRGDQARLLDPQYIAADARGFLYVIERPYLMLGQEERGIHLRRIAPDGTVVNLSAPGQWWGKPGAAAPAISKPGGLAIDAQGNLYISEQSASGTHLQLTYGGSIVKITPDGVASVFAGTHDPTARPAERVDGAADAARFFDATMLGFDADGNLYVDDGAIRKITPEGVVSTVAALPAGFGADAEGNRYVADGTTVTRIAANGERTVVAGQPGANGNLLGALPGRLYGGNLARTGPASFAVISGSAILKLVLPH